MRGFTLFLALLAISFLLANSILNDHGYVMIAYDGTTFETSLWGLLLLIILPLGVLGISFGLLKAAFSLLGALNPFSSHSRHADAQKQFDQSLIELIQGHWDKAEKLASKSAKTVGSPLVAYLIAAKSAHEQGNFEASTQWLRLADNGTPESSMAVGLTQAQLQMSSNHLEQALATLQHLHKQYPQHTYVLKMLKQVYMRLRDWGALNKLLPVLRKHKVISDSEASQLEKQACQALLEQNYLSSRHRHELEERIQPLKQIWESFSTKQKKDTQNLHYYCDYLARLGGERQAAAILRDNLGKQYNASLMTLYGIFVDADPQKQLLFAEGLLSQRTNDADLLLALGRIAVRNELWGKAQEYLEMSLKLHKNTEVYNELGSLFAKLEKFEESARCYQEALRLTKVL